MVGRALMGCVAVLAAAPGGAALAAPGDLDPTFAGTGAALTAVGDGGLASAEGLVVLADGRIVAAGYARDGGAQKVALARYLTDGTLDPGFGTGGLALTAIGDGNDAGASALALEAGGTVLASGYAVVSTNQRAAFARYGTGGTPDASLAPAGLITSPFAPSFASAEAVALTGTGFLAAGRAFDNGATKVLILRHEANGTPTPGFGATGGILFAYGNERDSAAHAVAVRPDGRFVIAGHARDAGADKLLVAGYFADGSPDTGFAPAPLFRAVGDGGAASGNAIALRPDGGVVVAGTARDGGGARLMVAAFDATGAPIAAFDGDGVALTSVGDGDTATAHAVALQPDGAILVAGVATVAGVERLLLARYLPDGALDAAFGSGGIRLVELGDGDLGALHAIALTADGRVVAAGQASSGDVVGFAVVRAKTLADPPVVAPPGTTPPVAVPPPAADTTPPRVTLSLNRRRFRVGPKPTAISARAAIGMTIRITLSEAATVSLRIERATKGRRSGSRCVARKPGASGRSCTRYVLAGTLRRKGRQGTNSVAFSGRIGRRALKLGKHRLVVRATDAARNVSSAKTATFTVVKR